MAQNLTQKILAAHLVGGSLSNGAEIAISIDQTLTQDATGTMAYLQFEAMGLNTVKTALSVSYIDHNTLQTGFENADDHRFLQTIAARYGIHFSRPGNGICHQVHLERFGVPGQTLLGSDSHTPTSGALGMLAFGAGGLDVAAAMAGQPFYLRVPRVINIKLNGVLSPGVAAKDIILEVLRRLTVKGGVGCILEYTGSGLAGISVPERATIANMGAETGATSSIFPSDVFTYDYLKTQNRAAVWSEYIADADAAYDEVYEINLNDLEPLVAMPHSPDKVVSVAEAGPIEVDQVVIGSCTNASYQDLMKVAAILEGKKVNAQVSLVIIPGSRQVAVMLARNGALASMYAAGVRILEPTCGPCIGMGQAPPSGGISVRTFNRNFPGRSGTADASVYLVSPETAAATAIAGVLTDPRRLDCRVTVSIPEHFDEDSLIVPPVPHRQVEIKRGPNIKSIPVKQPLADHLKGTVLIKVGDDITTDHIMPAGPKVLPLRSNIPAISEFVFAGIDSNFARRSREQNGGFIVGGLNYGQGSSREHAALAPMFLGIKAVLAKSFARIHQGNLVNFGILPLSFRNASDYELVEPEDMLEIAGVREKLRAGKTLVVTNHTKKLSFPVKHDLSSRLIEIVLAGGLLGYIKYNVMEE